MLSDSERSLLLEELARRPRGLAEAFTHEATLTTPACGDTVTVRVTLGPDLPDLPGQPCQPGQRFEMKELTWNGHGCTVSMAAAAAMCDLPLTSVPSFRAELARFAASVGGDGALGGDLEAFAGIGRFPLRGQCATLAWRALELALVGAEVDVQPAP